jgi:hypothetical protein
MCQNLLSRLSFAANQLFRRLTKPARPNLVTGTLADLPRYRAERLAENVMLRRCAGYPIRPSAFLASTGLGGSPTVIVVQPVQHWERHHHP